MKLKKIYILANQSRANQKNVTHIFLYIVLAQNRAGGGNAVPLPVQCTHLAAAMDSGHSEFWHGIRQHVPGLSPRFFLQAKKWQ